MLEKKDNSKMKYLTIIGPIVVIIAVLGITYAWFNYNSATGNQQIITGDIYMVLNENTEEISLTQTFPETIEEARARDDNYITFDIEGINTSSKDLYYEIILDHGEDQPSPKVRYNDTDLKFDLVELDSNGDEVDYLLSAVSYDTLINKRIYVNTIPASTGSEISKHYKIRMWLSDTVIISDTEPNATYSTSNYKNRYTTIKVMVSGDLQEKTAAKPASRLIKDLASTKSYIASYEDYKETDTRYADFTTQDTVGTNPNKQTVYYYTGEEAVDYSNVLFAGYCWQIIRTTDNGGVKLLYNGVAQKGYIYESVTIDDTEITYTNDATYPYSYNSTTRKWTSTNHDDDTTSTFIFTVEEAGDYVINYTISSESNWDVALFYKNNTQLKRDSGIRENKIFLDSLTTSDEIKITYSKDNSTSSGNDNVVFEITKKRSGVKSDKIGCQPTRESSEGIIGNDASYSSMRNVSVFGRSYDYNLATGQFTITDSTGLPTEWSSNDNNNNGIVDYIELIGTYTCKSRSNTCSTVYFIGNYSSDVVAYTTAYTIGPVDDYSQIGTSPFASGDSRISSIGYMFNKGYNGRSAEKEGEYFTNAEWNGTSYTLTNGNGGTEPDETHHYICDTNCTRVRYYYYYYSNGSHYYVLLENGETIEDLIYKATGNGTPETIAKEINANYRLNTYDSAIKAYIEKWYKNNLLDYTSYLDQTAVYCNGRNITDIGGFDPTGTSIKRQIEFGAPSWWGSDLNCVNEVDRFAVTNSKAKLNYPIGLLSLAETILMTQSLISSSNNYWGMSASGYISSPMNHYISNDGISGSSVSDYSKGVRPVVTLNASTLIESGTGTYNDPYIVGPIVDRNS